MRAREGVYVRMCEFRARPGLESDFEGIYGPEGDWAQLFRRSKAFLRTELHCDLETKGRYVTVDYFTSRSAYSGFLEAARKDYEALDRRCETVRMSEAPIGSFVLCGQ